ncbi:hypothetical protein [Ottowia caeni]|uniref:hypothetical protein n=1 Tax=Ottowia caeni TaxID=2870339 RepID=UPI001E35BF45|nr:hypothetical protein [Ottowia caeni]
MDRQETTRRFQLLQSQIAGGKFHVAPHLLEDFERSFARVALAADGLVDESTLDGRVRTSLLAVAYMADRQEWKDAISLKKIQEVYFERLANMFGQPYELMRKANADPYRFAGWFASDQTRVKETLQAIDEFVEGTHEFWENIADPTWIHLEDSQDTKAVFAGEIFPDGRYNVVSSTGIYFDITLLPDPFLKITPVLSHMDEAERVQEVLRLGLQAMAYRDLAVTDLAVPLVAVLPDRHSLQNGYKEFVHHSALRDTLRHALTLFGRLFSDIDELVDFLKHFKSSSDIASALVRPNELVFATEWEGDLPSHIDRYLLENGSKLNITHPGQAVFLQLVTRFSQANDSFQRSRELRATPVVRAETSWLWFNWMLRNNALADDPEAIVGLHLARALATAVKTEISWLGNVPPAALLEIRKEGALEEIREIMGTGIRDLVAACPDNFHRTGDKVVDNLFGAFRDHEVKLKELRAKKWKFAGIDVGSFLVVGGIELTAAITGLPLFGAAAATASRLGVVPTAKELNSKLSQIRGESKAVKSTGIGILFKHHRNV